MSFANLFIAVQHDFCFHNQWKRIALGLDLCTGILAWHSSRCAIHSRRLELGRALNMQATLSFLFPSFLLGVFIMFLSVPLLSMVSNPQLAYPAIVLTASALHFLCDFVVAKAERP